MSKRIRAEALISQGKQRIQEVVLNFSMDFAKKRRQRIETLINYLQDSLTQDDQRWIDEYYADLQLQLHELNETVRDYYTENEEDDLWVEIQKRSDSEDDNTGGSSPTPSPRRPDPTPGSLDSAELPPT
ncbi:hypothetical protein [Nostoc sp. LEGE 12450]|uniref:hypothetical protein n=1 Tax=Nostoc sp. LEGE 12450 TaxID=1828643 RepID=UPI00187FCDEC|nr:hypothetical protein [Nostoc sp. LEGE 12450]MBE8990160.1 hypothetical protein [Nostoc sp. LEGE 12450]